MCVAVPFLAAPQASAHRATSGWMYPASCCSDRDCSEVPDETVSEDAGGVYIRESGERLPYGDRRIHDSPDGKTHWCRSLDPKKPHTYCLFLPPKGM